MLLPCYPLSIMIQADVSTRQLLELLLQLLQQVLVGAVVHPAPRQPVKSERPTAGTTGWEKEEYTSQPPRCSKGQRRLVKDMCGAHNPEVSHTVSSLLGCLHPRCPSSHLTGDDNQICLLGVCLLITYVPCLPSLTVRTPCCSPGTGGCRG